MITTRQNLKAFESIKTLIPSELVVKASVYRNQKALNQLVSQTLATIEAKLPSINISLKKFHELEDDIREIILVRTLVY